MRHFPVFLDLAGREVLVLGEGAVAGRKAAPVLAAGARVRRAARFRAADLAGCALAIGADAPEAELRALAAAARAAGQPVNVVDRPELCTALMPAIVARDPVTVAVGTGGVAPVLARLLRARIEAAVPAGYGALARLAGEVTEQIRATWPEVGQRRRVLERIFSGTAAELALAGDEAGARAAIEATLAAALEGGRQAGIIHVVGAGPGEPDLVTLRGQRLLGEADLVLHDPAVPAGVTALARRDAEQAPMPAADAPALLRAARGAGLRVVWLVPGDGAAAWRAMDGEEGASWVRGVAA